MKIANLDIKKTFYINLNERHKRHFLAIEASQLGYGGISEVSRAFGVNRRTISTGITELKSGNTLAPECIRKEGAGRKKNGLRA